MVAGTLVNTGFLPREDVYAYTFATPAAIRNPPREGYENIFNTKLKLKMYQIWDGFCAVAKLNGGRRSSATLTGMKQRHGVKDAQR